MVENRQKRIEGSHEFASALSFLYFRERTEEASSQISYSTGTL